jgi:transcriptional regulator of acetoin/glycerol metabolism
VKPAAGERKRLQRLIVAHAGCHSAIGAALRFPAASGRQQVARLLRRHGLLAAAAQERRRGAIMGPRASAPSDVTEERAELVAALAQHGGYRGAAETLGISPRTMARRMKQHEITPDEVQAARVA